MIIYLLILHYISDFLLQTRRMAEQKSSNYIALVVHCSIIFIIFGLAGIVVNENWFNFALLNCLIHGIIDKNIWTLYKYSVLKRHGQVDATAYTYWKDSWFYNTIGLDQMLHMICMFTLYKYMVGSL